MTFKCVCGKEFDKPVTSGHKRKCPVFIEQNPQEDRLPPDCVCGHKSTSLTQMKRHRQKCDVWASRDKNSLAKSRSEATFEKRYGEGVTNSVFIPEINEKRKKTNIERYGAENVFCKESSIYNQVQSHWDGKDRTAHLPKDNFSRPEIKEKIGRTFMERYGSTNPFQVPEIKEKIKNYYLNNYGVENASQVPEIRAKQLKTTKERYGDEQAFRVPEIREKAKETSLERYGFDTPSKSPEVQEKVKKTNLERYGVEWTTQNPETRAKMNESFREFLSVPGNSRIYSTSHNEDAIRRTNLERFGATHFMKNPELARKHLEKYGVGNKKTDIEIKFEKMFPEFFFTGLGTYWRLIPSTNANKNPDFCYPVTIKEDGSPSFINVTHVVELFGDFWHGEAMKGVPNDVHEKETVDQWAEVGLKCLVIWEREIKKKRNDETVIEKVRNFLKI